MIAIIDYGMGNLHSVSSAVERLGYAYRITSDEKELFEADGAILPGVGAFGDAMEHLREAKLDDAVKRYAESGKPSLGICLGMQLLFSSSEEHGHHEGLGLLPGRVVRFTGDYKVPHMGWNKLSFRQPSPLFRDLEEGHVYFVHSYHALAGAGVRSVGDDGLLPTGDSDCRPRQCIRNAVPPGEERQCWYAVARQLFGSVR
ncbi:imidazole glycerol phosphate synthase subunit HisH [Paenibacillus sp. P26]|nr:imidazole glycerol phosphate synthase subunit HisH [Paenibacillus sp. P26]